MDGSRQASLSGVAALLRKTAPPPALCGFVLLLALIFTVSYAGAAAGPVAPGMRGTSTSGDGGGGVEDMGDMGGMGGMEGMTEEGR
ncbi:hypothetical protein [Streptomyces sp. NPDC002324]